MDRINVEDSNESPSECPTWPVPGLRTRRSASSSGVGRLLSKILAALLIPAVALPGTAQQTVPLSKKAAGIKRRVDALAPSAEIRVMKVDGTEEDGSFVSNDQTGLTLYDVDLKRDVTLTYAEVRKIKNGYGPRHSLQRKHSHRTRTILIVIAVLGTLGGVIAAAATAPN